MLRVECLSKTFHDPIRGDTHAVADVSFSVASGSVYGLLGPNGAGKTTILRCIVGLIDPTLGSVERPEGEGALGYLSAGAALPERLTCRETLRFFGAVHGLAGEDLERRIATAIARFGLEPYAEQPTSRLSTGYRQRLSLARALLHGPSLLVLDEATSGLDPLVARAVRQDIRRAADDGCAVLFSTHIMGEAASLCDRIGILARGRLLTEGTLPELLALTGARDLEDAFVALAGEAADERIPA